MSVFDINFSDLEGLEYFNKGNFGCLYKAKYFGTDVAVKKLLDIENKAMHKYIEREMSLLKTMRHPNIVQYMGMSKTDEDVYIITEYLNGGDLYDKLRDETIKIPWKLRVSLAIETCRAIAYLHSRGVVHRDLKSQNLLVDNNWKVKICDFGFARAADSKEYMTLCGTDEWMAPEIMLGEKYDERADIYSFGMILTEFIRRDDPPPRVPGAAYGYDEKSFLASVPKDCPKELLSCVADCTKFYPEARPDIKDVLKRLTELEESLSNTEEVDNEMTYMTIESDGDKKKKRRTARKKKSSDGKKKKKTTKDSTGDEEHKKKRRKRSKSTKGSKEDDKIERKKKKKEKAEAEAESED
mmetsp:Transcript_23757/g.30261  ORF Transcript_23757/g.30261 Transcript_23757/m.30261 type:complete len:354 (-) Transcript_23757:76-1137(-)|eukprot:CAMPEP_0206196584 /NCGR_PEP_ID=MMETSP0166-20121206/8538_1 /ASSEMBLY_ACC=CAM_ASM_000260 /TAXON_ID=95228 /ORGANISM="Vannella robusta, Strain DIVA3 518/3/11/1/6" /LENGTH=353 /DNA_ID=CAMNT_0053614093 /DNA_START=11 /DNA_END=1072 /DNA_ORIENTATION=-